MSSRSRRSAHSTDGQERQPFPKGFWVIWTTVALDLIGFGIVVPILGVYAKNFGATGFAVGFLFATFSLAQFVFSPLLGRLSDRIGRKPVIVISLIGTAIGSFVTGAAGALWVLFLGRVIDGASGASVAVAQAAVVDLAEPEERPRLIGMLGAAFGIGFVIGPAIGGLAALGGPHVPFYVAAALAGANAIAAIIRLPETRPEARQRGVETQRAARHFALPAAQRLRRLAVLGVLGSLAFAAFEATFSLFGNARFGLTEGSTAGVFLCIGLVLSAVQGGVFSRLVVRLTAPRLYVFALLLSAVGLATTSAATVWPVLIVGLFVLTVAQGMANPSLTVLVNEAAPPERRGEALGFQQSANSMGRVLGPPIAGAAFDHIGVWSPMLGASLLSLLLVGLVVVWHMHRPVNPSAA